MFSGFEVLESWNEFLQKRYHSPFVYRGIIEKLSEFFQHLYNALSIKATFSFYYSQFPKTIPVDPFTVGIKFFIEFFSGSIGRVEVYGITAGRGIQLNGFLPGFLLGLAIIGLVPQRLQESDSNLRKLSHLAFLKFREKYVSRLSEYAGQ